MDEKKLMQQMLDEQTKKMKEEMNSNINAAKSDGLLDPVHGVSIEDWAAANAKIVQGENLDNILKVLQIEKPIWDEINAEWNGRMSRDSTFAITTVYGQAFVNSNIGRFANAGKEAANSMTNVDGKVGEQDPISLEEWIKITQHQAAASKQGIDASSILKNYGLTVADWSTVSAYWSQKFNQNAMEMIDEFNRLTDKYEKEFSTLSSSNDIDF